MIAIINGPCGIGKTSVAWELNARFDRAVMLDGDYIGAVHPFEIYDEARVAYLFETIHHLIAFHIEQGSYHDFVINYVFETPEELAALRHLLSDLDDVIYAYRLVASDDVIEERIRKRELESDADPRWHLKRYRELVAIQEQAAKRGDVGGFAATQLAPLRVIAAPVGVWYTEGTKGYPMPTVLRVGRYRFFFFSNEGQELPHIHVKAGSDQASSSLARLI